MNYDTNLDKLTDSKIYHLHGSFDVLYDTYRPDTINGYLAQSKVYPPAVVKGKEHLYCNAIMGFSGPRKLEINNTYSNGIIALENMIARLNNPLDVETRTRFECLKTSSSPISPQLIRLLIHIYFCI